MTARGPILLFIGLEPNGDLAWREVRRLCQPGRALRASDAYRGLALLLKLPQLSVVVVAVDCLSDSEMSFFLAARRHCPQLHLLAFGQGNELSNPRLAQATWQGATEAVGIERLAGRLSELMGAEKTYLGSSPLAQAPDRQVLDLTEPSPVEPDEPKPTAPETMTDAGFRSLLQARTVVESKRKAPAAEQSKQQLQRQTQDVVTPEELRVLLGEDAEETQEPDNRKGKRIDSETE